MAGNALVIGKEKILLMKLLIKHMLKNTKSYAMMGILSSFYLHVGIVDCII